MRTIKQALESGLTIRANNLVLWHSDEGYYWLTDDDMSIDDQLNYPIICTRKLPEALKALEQSRKDQSEKILSQVKSCLNIQ